MYRNWRNFEKGGRTEGVVLTLTYEAPCAATTSCSAITNMHESCNTV